MTDCKRIMPLVHVYAFYYNSTSQRYAVLVHVTFKIYIHVLSYEQFCLLFISNINGIYIHSLYFSINIVASDSILSLWDQAAICLSIQLPVSQQITYNSALATAILIKKTTIIASSCMKYHLEG